MAVRLDERELTKLWYVADAIVRAPASWQTFFAALADRSDDRFVGRSSPRLQRSLKAIRDALQAEREINSDTVKRVAANLLKGEESARDAGRALAWALENAAGSQRTAAG